MINTRLCLARRQKTGDDVCYYYVTNIQGDVVAIVSLNGIPVVEYTYDAWGNILSVDGSRASNLGKLNPLRYRGYVYDVETGLYYLQSRYYNPEMGRFITSDIVVSTGQGLIGNNTYAYCCNNPVTRIDKSGNSFETVWDVISLCSSIVEVCVNPSDPWAWIGLAGDVLDVAIPFVGGLGEAIHAIDAATEVVDTVDDVHDTLNVVDNTSDSLTTLYRSVSNAEAEDILSTGQFNLPSGGMESKQFGFDLAETQQFGKWAGQDKIVSASIPTKMLNQFYTEGVDTSIFRAGTLTVYGDQLDVFNRAVRGTIRFIP